MSYYQEHNGADSAAWFVEELKTIADRIEEIFQDPEEMMMLTKDEKAQH